jgi:Putative metallopeptidase
MTAPRRNRAAGVAAGVTLAALAATPALAQSQDAARTLANGESIVIDGRTFSITPGTSTSDLANPSGQPGARRLGAGVVIFRSGDDLYMVDRAPPPPTATTADTPASGPPRADGPRNTIVDCGRVSAVRDQAAYAPPSPNGDCPDISGQRDMERQRPNALGGTDNAHDGVEHMEENPRIHVEYQTPKDPARQKVHDVVKQHHVLETVRKIFSPWNLGDIDLNIRTMSCGVANAWYQRVGKVPTVTICYEYLQEIWDSMPEETKAVLGESMQDAICGQLFFAVAHELGHAMFDIFDVPVFGRQEDAADQFATFIMLQFGGEQALQLIDGAAYGYRAYINDLSTKPQVTLPLASLASDHGSPEERYFNLICAAYGYDARLFSVEMNKIPPSRAQKCKFEYEDLKFAFHTTFWPHLDHDKVKRVLAMKWFIDINATASTSKAN